METGTIAITGASGFLGQRLVAHFHARGWEVRALVREPAAFASRIEGVRAYRCDLPDALDDAGIDGADALVHAAYATRATSAEAARRVNESGTRRILDAARAADIPRFVFLSSLSAHEGAESYYGRSKLAVEATLDLERDLVLRLGLVLAREGDGLFRRLVDAVARARFVPVFEGGRQVLQTLHEDDFCAAVERALAKGLTGRLAVAEPEGLTYRELLQAIAARLGRRCTLVPLPMAPALGILRAVELLRVPLPVTRENLLGLRALRFVPTAADLERLGIAARPAGESLDALLGATLSS